MSVPAAYLGVILIWSTTPLAIQWSSEGWGFLIGVSTRMTLGMVVCYAVLKLLKNDLPWHKQARQTYIAAGAGVYGAMISVYWGAQFIPSGLIAVIFGLSPIVTALLATYVLKEQGLTAGKVLGMTLGLVGLFIIFRSDFSTGNLAWQGIAAVLVSAFIHSGSSVTVKKIAAGLPAMTVTSGALIIATPAYLITWFFLDGAVPEHGSLRAGMAIIYLVVIGTVIGFSLFYYILKNIEASRVALITLITPVIALLIGQLLNDEVISVSVWVGALCIITALIMHQWADDLFARW